MLSSSSRRRSHTKPDLYCVYIYGTLTSRLCFIYSAPISLLLNCNAMSTAIADTPSMSSRIPNLPFILMLSPPNTHTYPFSHPHSFHRPPHPRIRQTYSFGQPLGPPLPPINLKRTSSMRDLPKGATGSPDADGDRDRETAEAVSVHDQQQLPTPVTANSSRGKSRRRKDV